MKSRPNSVRWRRAVQRRAPPDSALGRVAITKRKQTKPVPTNRRSRAQRFLRDELADGPKRVTDVEEAAAKAHVDPETLERARGDHILLAE